jgi:hypothetical protein
MRGERKVKFCDRFLAVLDIPLNPLNLPGPIRSGKESALKPGRIIKLLSRHEDGQYN